MKAPRHLLLPAIVAATVAGCSKEDPELAATVAAHEAALREMPRDFYRPGLGDMMNALQTRHAKLWFAGQAQNWRLAEFELDEIEESLERIAHWHKDNEDVPMAPSIKAHTHASRYALKQSIAKQDVAAFTVAFDRLTDGCNSCHRAAKHEFIMIQRPTAEPVGNQRWGEAR
jgi:hypothetical protein